jgi:predicted GIY-YIG superfamily endonuclease
MRYVLKNKNISDKGTFEFYKEILDMELNKNEFKILIMILALKNNNKVYKSTLRNMCEFLNLSYSSTNKKNIKNALNSLTKKEILEYSIKKTTYTIKLILKYNNKNIIQIDRKWLETIKIYKASTTNTSVDWSNLLKVFLCLIDNNNSIIDSATIARKVDLSCSIVNKALAAIKEINTAGGFGCGFTVEREYYNNHTFSEKPQGFYLYKYEDTNKEIVYIGQTISLTQRIQQHTQDKLQDFSGIVYYVECGSKEEMDFLEKVLINYYKPKFNIIHKDRNDLTTKLVNINLDWQFYTKITD